MRTKLTHEPKLRFGKPLTKKPYKKLYRYVKSDNFEGYMTEQAYQELRLQMSSGDFGSHTVDRVALQPISVSSVRIYTKAELFQGE